MKKVIAVLLLLIAVVTAALIYFTFGKPAPRAASLLPESTLAFIDIPDLSKSRTEFAKTEFYALWHEPEVQAFLAQPLVALLRHTLGHASLLLAETELGHRQVGRDGHTARRRPGRGRRRGLRRADGPEHEHGT